MAWEPSVFTLVLAVAASMAAGLAAVAWRRPDRRGSRAFSVMMVGITLWCLGDAVRFGLTTLPPFKFWSNVSVIGTIIAPTAALVFTLQYAGFDRWVDRRSVALLSVMPTATTLLLWTNPSHHWLWEYTGELHVEPVASAPLYWGPWFLFHLIYNYGVMAVALGLLSLVYLRSRGVYRRQTTLLLVGATVPLFVNVLWLLGLTPAGADFSSLAFTVTGVFFAAGLYAYDLLDLEPVARHSAVESVRDGLITVDREGRIADANPVARRLLSPDDGDLVGRNAAAVIPQHDALVEGEDTDDIVVDADDGRRYFDVQVSRLTETASGDAGQVLLLRDVTERRRLEKRYQLLIENASDLIHVVEADGQIAYVSPSVERVLGYTPADLEGEDALSYIHPDDREVVGERLAELASNPDAELHAEFRVRAGDGSYRIVESRGRNLLADPVVEGVVVNSRDVTRRKRRERALERQNEQLEEFASVISHDLRNPLAVARAYTDLLEKEYDDHRLPKVQDAHRRMDELLEELLTLAREGRTVDEPDAVSLADVAEAAWQTVETHDATLSVTADTTLLADELRLRQLLENLFRNAIEHAGTDTAVEVGPLEDGFYVEDDGPGIPESEREDVFEAGVTSAEDGTGFGLAIVARIADAHGWRVRATDGKPVTVAEADGGTERAAATAGARFEFSEVDTPG